MNKPSNTRSKTFARPLSDVLAATLSETFAKQGFASTELVTRWTDIVGPEIGAHSQPAKLQWPRQSREQAGSEAVEPATLILRVEGPSALEIQHLSAVILERVNRFFGWQAVGRIALRQAPLSRPAAKPEPRKIDAEAAARIAASLPAIADEDLRQALARLGAAIKQK